MIVIYQIIFDDECFMMDIERLCFAQVYQNLLLEVYNYFMPYQFEWHSAKAKTNLAKHNVSFDEASTVFDDSMFITVLDDEHSQDDERYITIGFSKNSRILIIAHTEQENP